METKEAKVKHFCSGEQQISDIKTAAASQKCCSLLHSRVDNGHFERCKCVLSLACCPTVCMALYANVHMFVQEEQECGNQSVWTRSRRV